MDAPKFELPWSSNQLKKLSKALRDGVPPPDGAPSYEDVMLFYNEVAVGAQRRITDQDWTSLLGSRPLEVTSRSKTVDTLVQKLQRNHETPLPSVQDIAGVRFEAEMSLSEQDAVVDAICGFFDQPRASIHDLRATPHSGYRAVHIWIRLPVRVEVQVRTHLQGRWANMYESAADALGREIRYGSLPVDERDKARVKEVQQLSVRDIAQIEKLRDQLEGLEAKLADAEGVAGNWLVKASAPRRTRNAELLRTVDILKRQIRFRERALEAETLRLKSMFERLKE